MHANRIRSIAVIITALAGCALLAAQTPPAAPAPAQIGQPGSETPLDPVVDRILTRLENRQVNDLQALVSWKLEYVLGGTTTKEGRIWYQQQKPVPKFLIHFERKITDNRLMELDERHMFDGRWYTEMNSDTKTLIRREVRREGEEANPYRLGEGPFPVPFGQRKADVIREYEVSYVPPTGDDPPETDRLRLVPRPGTQGAENFKQVEVWIARAGPESGLPVKVLSAKKDPTGKVSSTLTITFREPAFNQGFSGSVFQLQAPPGYHVEEERLGPAAVPAARPQPPAPRP